MNVISIDPGIACTGFYVFLDGRGYHAAARRPKGRDNYAQLVAIREAVLLHGRWCDFALVEDYPYGAEASVAASAIEAGGVVRAALAELGLPVIVIAIPTWKSLTIGHKPKGTVPEKAAYLDAVEQLYGVRPAGTDEADAFLIYRAALRIWQEGPSELSEAQVKIKESIAAIRNAVADR